MPTVNLKNLRAAVQEFDWKSVFSTSLKWTKPTDKVRTETIDGERFTLTPIADTGGMQVYVVRRADGMLPPRPTRNKLEIRLRRTQVEHILVFEDAAKTQAVLQWVKRGQQGRRAREFAYRRGESGEPLIQKLQGIAFAIDDFDPQGRIEISKVTARVEKNLDVEHVTKKFYNEFDRQRNDFQKFLCGIAVESDQRWYVSVMLNRLMFIYFIQAKGFLNNTTDYLRERLEWSKANLGANRYYRDFLRVLFFQGFALEPGQRSADVNKKLGKIPYLNGGLFLPHPIEDHYGEAVDIPDSAFDKLFTFFDGWHWHLSERPGTSDKEIDPDVLGYIFEKYINNREMGAYYTRDDITGYICRNTIIPALFDKAGLSLAILDLPHTIGEYIYPAMKQEGPLPTETERELIARHARVAALVADAKAGKIATINDAVTANLDLEELIEDLIPQLDATKVYSLYTALAGDPQSGKLPLSVLDPTVGSGAFLFAALRVLKPIYEAVLDRMEELAEAKQAAGRPLREVLNAAEEHSNRDYFITKSIVVRNLYGVDLMAEATEICKLRLFLRMVADLDEAKHIEPLPDIDFNIRAGNTLVGYARPDEIGLVYKDKVAGLSPRQQKLLEEIRAVQRELTVYRNAQLQFNPSAAEGRVARQTIRERLDAVNAGLDTDMLKIGLIHKDAEGRYNTRPFHWFTAFYEILSDGGFDVIVGNPPYVETKEVKEYKLRHFETLRCGDLYACVMERGYNVSRSLGRTGFIVPISSFGTDGFALLQQFTLSRSKDIWLSHFANRPSQLFEGAQKRLTIVITSSGDTNSSTTNSVQSTSYIRWKREERGSLFPARVSYTKLPDYFRVFPASLEKIGSNLEYAAFSKLVAQDTRLADVIVPNTNHRLYYTRKFGYFLAFLDFIPSIIDIKTNQVRLPSELKELTFESQTDLKVAIAALSSSTFYWFWNVLSDVRNLNRRDLLSFPINPKNIDRNLRYKLGNLASKYITTLRSTSRTMTKSGLKLETFEYSACKPIIDEIDRVLAAHYGFTPEELDFIIKYVRNTWGRGQDVAQEASRLSSCARRVIRSAREGNWLRPEIRSSM